MPVKKINTDLPQYIGSYSIARLIDEINEVKSDSEISFNTWGGETAAGQRFISYLNENKYNTDADVAGQVASMGVVILPFFNKVRGAKQADVMFHSVGGGNDANVEHTRKFLYKALAKKIDEAKFEEVTGHKLKTVMFAKGEERFSVWITGKQAFEIGLFDEVYDLIDGGQKDNKCYIPKSNQVDYDIPPHIAEKYGKSAKVKKVKKPKENIIPKNNNLDMEVKDITLELLKKDNIALYNSIIGIERERIAKINKIGGSDPVKRDSLIETGAELSVDDAVHFTEKKQNLEIVKDLEDSGAPPIIPGKVTKTEVETEKEAAHKELHSRMGFDDLTENSKK